MNRKQFFPNCLLLLLVIIATNACRTHKPVVSTGTTGEVAFASCYPVGSITVPKCKLEISDGNKSWSLNGSLYIRPDSVCYFRGAYLNTVEVMRGVIYRDSFIVINYIDRVCYKGKNEYLSRISGYPVSPESLLLLFTADRCEKVYREKLAFRTVAGSDNKIMMLGRNRSSLEINITPENRTVGSIALYNRGQRQALFSASYSGYNRYGQFVLPTVFNISAHDGKNTFGIKASFQQILFDQPQQINLKVPSRYRVVELR